MSYKAIKLFMYIFFRALFRIEVRGSRNIPSEGGVIICSNHVSAYDALIIAIVMKARRPFFLAKKELFQNKFLCKLFLTLGAYPVDRDATDLRAYRWALGVLRRGDVLGIFSQGSRYAESAKSGTALFAIKARVPVVPCGISGTCRPFSKITVTFGEPICLGEHYGSRPGKELLEKITADIMTQVYKQI